MPDTNCGFDDANGVIGKDLLIGFGPTIQVDIGFDPSFSPTSNTPPIPGIRGVRALVDTGAGACCIDSSLAMQLKLPIIDRQHVSGISGRYEVNMHLAQVHIPSLSFTMYGPFAGVDLVAGGQPHFALIGRTFLQHCKMTYDGTTGKVTITR